MKLDSIIMRVLQWFLYYFAAVLFVVNIVFFTAEDFSEGTELYYALMLWVSFGVLAFLYMKLANKPLKKFLKGQGDVISEQLNAIEDDVKKARSILDEESSKLKDIDDKIEEITKNILAVGKREKENIIEKAKFLADKMVEDAKSEAAFKMEIAKKRFSEDMLELAVSLAIEKMRADLTSEDDENLVLSFSSGLSDEKDHFA